MVSKPLSKSESESESTPTAVIRVTESQAPGWHL